MPIWQAVILGVIQGLTEFLPVSSSAHLAAMPLIFGWRDQGLEFDIALHAGTLVAVIIYFFKDWVQIIAGAFGIKVNGDPAIGSNPKLLWLLVAATIPAGVIGLLFENQAEQAGNNLYVIGTMMIAIGIVMWLAERMSRQKREFQSINLSDALTIGAAQALAVVPGTSRSGITISTGMFRNIDRYSAARFSFLLSTPIIAGAALKKLIDILQHGISPDMRMAFAVGILVSAITGALTIRLFLNSLRHRSLAFFVTYRIIFGIIVIALAFFRSSES